MSIRCFLKFSPAMLIVAIAFFVTGAASCLAAPAPKVFFSDLTDGTVIGWNGSTSKGAAVSIWGNNFGSSRGASYVTVGGVHLIHNTDYAEWAATTKPTTPRGLQRITFWLNSSMSLGNTTITVTTADGTSEPISFYTRNIGNIYFVARDGSDSNNGLSTEHPWFSFTKVRQSLQAGDVVYVRSGVWSEYDRDAPYGGAVLSLEGGMFNNGTTHKTISIVSYPGEVAQLGDGSTNGPPQSIQRSGWSGSTLENWSFSKLKCVGYDYCFSWVSLTSGAIDRNMRVVGMDLRTTHAQIGHGMIMMVFSSWQNVKLYGNYLHHAGKLHDDDPHGYKVESIYFAGGGVSDGIDIGWNEMYRNNGTIQFFGHFRTDSVDHLLIHDNFVHDNGTSIVVLGGGDPQANPQYEWLHHVSVFNNVFSGNGGGARIATTANGLSGDFEIYHNTFYNNCTVWGGKIIETQGQDSFSFNNNIVVNGPNSKCSGYWTNQIAGYDSAQHSNNETGDHNLWHGSGNGPSWDTNSFENVSPQFIVENPSSYFDFRLKESSPIIVAGQKTGVQFDVVPQDDPGDLSISAPLGFSLVNN